MTKTKRLCAHCLNSKFGLVRYHAYRYGSVVHFCSKLCSDRYFAKRKQHQEEARKKAYLSWLHM